MNKMERRRKHEGETGEDNWQRKVEKERRKGEEERNGRRGDGRGRGGNDEVRKVLLV